MFILLMQMNDDEPRKQMVYLLRNYNVGIMKRNWMYLFSEVSIAYLDISCHCVLIFLPFYTLCQYSGRYFFLSFFKSLIEKMASSLSNFVEHLKTITVYSRNKIFFILICQSIKQKVTK